MNTYFGNVPVVQYEGKGSKNPFAFKFYNPDEIVMGKTMRETLKFAMSYWHTMCGDGHDIFGDPTIDRTYNREDEMERARAKADAAFEFMNKLGIDYFCFHDVDIAPQGKSLAEFKENLAAIAEYIKTKMDETGVKVLWGTANLFSHPRYMHGAGTSPNADSFAYAAAQIKNAMDATIALNGAGYVFWGGREGYETLLNTNMALELDNMARLLKMAVDYKKSRGFNGDFYIEPKPKEPTKHQYDFDAATVISFLRKYGLDQDFKLNIEANHATLAMHTFQHEVCTARINGFFGSIDANRGDELLGWDTDQFPTNVYDTTLCMTEIIKAGGFTNGGLNFDAKVRRGSYKPEDIALAYISGMDAFALGLKNAEKIIADGRMEKFVSDRYASYGAGIGEKIVSGSADFAMLEQYALQLPEIQPQSGGQEYLESILNEVLFS